MIVVVSGLPRSGTSLMMQMLEAGGLPVLTDRIRKPDRHNPRGYYEFEPVKRLGGNNTWLNRAEGHVVKIVSVLLYQLPPGRDYRIILMERDMDEVIASQDRMLPRRKEQDIPAQELKRHFRLHMKRLIRWLHERNDMKVLQCRHAGILADPLKAAKQVKRFLGLPLKTDKMASAVETGLYRCRKGVR